MRRDVEAIATIVINEGFRLHCDLGPGLFESVYEAILADRLVNRGLKVETQKLIEICVDGKSYPNAFRADLVINSRLLLELKSVENLSPVHIKQALTYIRLMKLPLGILMNFGAATFKSGVKRIMNDAAQT